MATSKEFKTFILEQLSLLDNIKCRPMMGGYLLYYKDCLFGGLYQERLMVKKVEENKKFNLIEDNPYEGAKPMYLIEELDNREHLRDIIISTYEGLINIK
ncbi:TfoX/Sxy family protein [Acholeplasma hippikon]|uniref:Regulator of competence-specific genes n=1 Tax=Acholeplasma hippikon TaxID=264636 RepID=A0A449BIZ9_9MOLU|nr:TfoX/Sxy family protein [Acholeplasma hippikon]VEU82436.1 Regulator of competence-specific genes [Acholeplasma hippikon]